MMHAMVQHLLGDCRSTLKGLAAGSVQCSVTSPPYYRLRSYLAKDHPLKSLEIGNEPTASDYIASLMQVFDQVHRVTRDDGTAWVNIADSYNSIGGNYRGVVQGIKGEGGSTLQGGMSRLAQKAHRYDADRLPSENLQAGDMCGIPWLFAQAMQSHGWIFRDVIVWRKPSPMPASLSGWEWTRCRVKVRESERAENQARAGDVTRQSAAVASRAQREAFDPSQNWIDCPGCPKCKPNGGYVLSKGSWRCTPAWEPIFMFSKAMNYFCDGHALRTPAAAATIGRNNYTRVLDDPDEEFAVRHDHDFSGATANMRNVWDIPTEPTKYKHYAAYPTKLAANCIAAGTSARGCCPTCGMGWARIVESPPVIGDQQMGHCRIKTGPDSVQRMYERGEREPRLLGWRQSCACPPREPVPQTVLDPFAGTGRTGKAAVELGRKAILCELNEAYLHMQKEQGRQQLPLIGVA